MIKNGFKIEDRKIFDTKMCSYTLCKEFVGGNVIFYMKPSDYKRLYLFEILLDYYSIIEVFKILSNNTYLKKDRIIQEKKGNEKLHYMSNMSVIYNYPPKYLTNKSFTLYKKCQNLKKKLD